AVHERALEVEVAVSPLCLVAELLRPVAPDRARAGGGRRRAHLLGTAVQQQVAPPVQRMASLVRCTSSPLVQQPQRPLGDLPVALELLPVAERCERRARLYRERGRL